MILQRTILIVSGICLLGLPGYSAEKLWVIKDGKLDKKALKLPSKEALKHPFWKSWVNCAGKTVDGLFVAPRKVGGKNNHSRFVSVKSALGDCEFQVVFSYQGSNRPTSFPNVCIASRGSLRFTADGKKAWMSLRKHPLPLKGFVADCPNSIYDGKLHTLKVTRVGTILSFTCDGKKLNEQKVDPKANLHIWFDSLFASTKIKSIQITADKLSDQLDPFYKSAAPIKDLFVGKGGPSREYGKAAAYRIPAITVSTKGTILAFAEARRIDGRDIGDIDAVVRRSEDGGKTWGPEIVIWDDQSRSVNNPSAVVDPKTGRIWLFMGHWVGSTPSQHVAYSDDDGRTWSKAKEMTHILRKQIKDGRRLVIPGPGSGIALTRGKHAGRLIIPMNHGRAWGPSVVYSDDHGKTWQPGGALHSNIGESKCTELADGSVLFVGNPAPPETRRRLTIISAGGTKNSTKLWHAKELQHASCQGAVARHSFPQDGKPGLILYSGPGSVTARAKGTLRGSYDEGKTWTWKLEYYQGPSGYSDIAVLPDGRVAVIFEKDGKSKLGFTILPTPPAMPNGNGQENSTDKGASRARKKEAMLFLIAGDANAEGQAPFSQKTNSAVGYEALWPVSPGSTAEQIGLPIRKEAYQRSFIWSLAKHRFEPLTPGVNLLANLRRRGRAVPDPNRHGVELPLAHRLQQLYADKDIFFVKVAVGGTSLYKHWRARDGAMYKKLVSAHNKAMDNLRKRFEKVTCLGIYWDQCEGEFDFNVGTSPMKSYAKNLAEFVKALRADFNQPELRYFLPKQMFHQVQEAWQPVVSAQLALCRHDKNCLLIDIDRGRYSTNMKLWSWTHNWTTLSSKGYAALADRISTELMLSARSEKARNDASPNTKRPAIVFLIAGQSNAGGTATLSIAHRRAAGYQSVWPADPNIVAENCGIPIADRAYRNCFLAVNNAAFQAIAPASAMKSHKDAFASQGRRKREFRHGIELPVAYRLRRQFPNHDVYIIKVYGGGKNLHTHWNPDVRGQFFDLFLRTVPPALSGLKNKYPDVRVVGLYWDQGESDIGPKASLYQPIFRKLIARMRAATRLPKLKFFVRKHIFYHHMPESQVINTAYATIAAEDPNVYVLDIDLGAKTLDSEPNFDAWSCTFRNIHLGSKAFGELTRLIFDQCIPKAESHDFLPFGQSKTTARKASSPAVKP